MSKTKSWYPFYPGDYARDTKHLSLVEHGAYRVLLDHYYATGKPLLFGNATSNATSNRELMPDHSRLYRICGAISKAEQDAVDTVLSFFFTLTDEGYYNAKAAATLEKQKSSYERRSKAGKAGADAKNKQAYENKGKSGNATSNATAMLKQPEPEPEPKYKPPKAPHRGDGVDGFFWMEKIINDTALKRAKANAPGWDVYGLMKVYSEGINAGTREAPRNPNGAFPAWCAAYTKGKSP